MTAELSLRNDGFNRYVTLLGAGLYAQVALLVAIIGVMEPDPAAAALPAREIPSFQALTVLWLVVALGAVGVAMWGGRAVSFAALAVASAIGVLHVSLASVDGAARYGFFPSLEVLGLALAGVGFLGLASRRQGALVDTGASPLARAAVPLGLTGPLGLWIGRAALVQMSKTGETGESDADRGARAGTVWLIVIVVYMVVISVAEGMIDQAFS